MTTLRIALRNYSDFENALGEQARLFNASHPDITVQLVSLGIHELYQSALNEGGLRNGRYDLALLVTDWLAEGMASRSLEDLQIWQDRLPIPDWPEGWPRSLVRPLIFDGNLSSLPWHDGPECLVYRSDIFADPNRREGFLAQFGRELAPPVTWQEFEETAQFLTDKESGLYGTVSRRFPMDTTRSMILHCSSGAVAESFSKCPRRASLNSPQAIRASIFTAASRILQLATQNRPSWTQHNRAISFSPEKWP